METLREFSEAELMSDVGIKKGHSRKILKAVGGGDDGGGGGGGAANAAAAGGQSVRLRVHASFSSQVKSWIISGIQDAVARAGMDYTAVHTAQKDGWFIVWSGKAYEADFIIVLFTPEVS